MAREGIKFSGEDSTNYENYLGPLLFEPSALQYDTPAITRRR
jgi:hypothetical protein